MDVPICDSAASPTVEAALVALMVGTTTMVGSISAYFAGRTHHRRHNGNHPRNGSAPNGDDTRGGQQSSGDGP